MKIPVDYPERLGFSGPAMKMNTVHWINRNLDWRIDKDEKGQFLLHNEFGFAGIFKSLNEALQAHARMGVEPRE